MAKRKFNWKLAVVLLLTLIVLGFTVTGLRLYQRTKQAEEGLRAGTLAYEEERWSDAATSLGQYIARHRDDIEILLKYAHAQLNIRPSKSGSVSQAISAYRAVLRKDPSNHEAIESLTQLYLAPGVDLAGEAELVASRYISLYPEAPPEIRQRLAMAQIRLGKTREAAQTLDWVIKTQPDFVPAYETLGLLAEQEPGDVNDPEREPGDVNDPAPNWFDRAVTKNPESPAARLARANYFLRQYVSTRSPGDLTSAKENLVEAEALAPSEIGDQLRLAALWVESQEPNSAEIHLEAVKEKQPGSLQLWQTWARAATALRSDERMIEIAEEGLAALDGNQAMFLPAAAELFIGAGELAGELDPNRATTFDRAQNCIDKMGDDERFAGSVAFLQGLLLQVKSEYRAAVAQYKRALELGYSDTPRVQLLMSQSLQHAGDDYANLAELRSMVSNHPRSFRGRMELARALLRRQQWEEAHAQAREASLLLPENQEATLLELEIRIRRLSNAGDVSEDVWKDIETRLEGIAGEIKNADLIRDLRWLIAMGREEYDVAETLLGAEPDPNASHPSQWLIARARLLSAQGDPNNQAGKLLQDAVDLHPENVQIAVAWAGHLIGQGSIDEGIQVLENALKVVKAATLQDAKAARDKRILSFELVKLYDRVGQTERAAEHLARLKSEAPKDKDIKVLRFLLSRRLVGVADANDVNEVQEIVNEVQEIVNTMREVEGEEGLQWRYEQARLWAALPATIEGRGEEIVQLLEGVLRSNPTDQSSRVLLAFVQEKLGNRQIAVGIYREALERDPDNIRIIEMTVRALQAIDPVETLAITKHGLTLDPNNSYLLQEQVTLMERLGNRDGITPLLKKLHDLTTNNVQVLQEQVTLMERLGNRDGTTPLLEKLHALKTSNVRVGAKLAGYLIAEEKLDDANDLLTRMEETDPDAIDILMARANYLLVRGQFDKASVKKASDVYDRMVEKQESVQTLFQRARFLEQVNRFDDAAADYARAVELDPDNYDLRDARSRFHLRDAFRNDSRLHLRDKNLALAIQELEAMYQQHPEDTDLAIRLGNLYIGNDSPEKAVALLQKHLSGLDPKDSLRPSIALARAIYRSGQKREGERLFEELEKRKPGDVEVLGAYLQTLYEGEDWLTAGLVSTRLQAAGVDMDVATAVNLVSRLDTLPAGNDNAGRKLLVPLLEHAIAKNPLDLAMNEGMMKLAQLYQMEGRLDDANDVYQQVIDRAARVEMDVATAVNLVSSFDELPAGSDNAGRERLVLLLEHAIAKNPLDLAMNEGMMKLAQLYQMEGRLDDANDAYQQVIDSAADGSLQKMEALSSMALLHRSTGNFSRAIQELEIVYQQYPKNMNLALRLGNLYISNDEPEKAVALLQKNVSGLGPEDSFGPRIVLARSMYRSGQKIEGERLFEELDKSRPGNVAVLATYLQTLYEGEDWLKAETVSARLRASGVDMNVATAVDLVSRLDALPAGNDNEGRELLVLLLKHAISKNPLDLAMNQGMMKLAQLYQNMGRMDEAIDAYQLVIDRAADGSLLKAIAVNNLAWLLGVEQGDYQAAYNLTAKAVVDFAVHDYYDLEDTHGVICWRLGKLEEAVLYLSQCLEDPQSNGRRGTGTRFHLGQVLKQMGRQEEARTHLEEARRMNNNAEIGGLSDDDKAKLDGLLAEL